MSKGTTQNELKELFDEESQDLLKNLETQLFTLETERDSVEAILEIYRIIHSFKGLMGTMGFSEFEKFFHEYENFLSFLKKNKITISQEILDDFFKSIDIIEKGLRAIDQAEEPDVDAFSNLIRRLNSAKKGYMKDDLEIEKKSKIESIFREYGLREFTPDLLEKNLGKKKIFQLNITIDPNAKLKTARFFIVGRALNQVSEIIHTIPSLSLILDGELENSFQIFLITNASREEIKKTVMSSGEISAVNVKMLSKDSAKAVIIGGETEEDEGEEEVSVSKKELTPQIDSVNVRLEDLDQLLGLFGELLIRSKQLENKLDSVNNSSINEILFQTQNYLFSLQDLVLDMQLVPINSLFRIFPRMIRSLARKQRKNISLKINHNDIKVDRKILNELGEILNHLLRNAVSHGIMSPARRVKVGKDETGVITIDCSITSNLMEIRVKDDGEGINLDKIRKTAINLGLYSETAVNALSDSQLMQLIFRPNFSTKSDVDMVSGRGFGMNIVQKKIRQINGSITVDSTEGEGTTFILQFPLSKSLIKALLVQQGEEIFSISLDDIQSLYQVSKENIRIIGGQEFVLISNQNELLRLYRLSRLFKLEEKKQLENEKLSIIQIKKGEVNYAVSVDKFLKESEIVVKKMANLPVDVKGVSGAAILEDGTVSLIINPLTMVEL